MAKKITTNKTTKAKKQSTKKTRVSKRGAWNALYALRQLAHALRKESIQSTFDDQNKC